MIRTSIAAAALGAVLCAAAPASATQGRSVTVSYADLNLATDAGRAAFDRRIGRAARLACDALPSRILSVEAANRRCTTQAIADAQPAIDAALRKSGHATLAARDDRKLVLRGQ